MNRVLSRAELSRILVMYGAFTASGRIMDEDDDHATLDHLRRLQTRLDAERAAAIDRVIRGLCVLMDRSRA